MKTFTYTIYNRNFQIFVGQNSKENWNLIDSADSFDLWFHIEGFPSGHVIIKETINTKNTKNAKIDYPNELLLNGAMHCKNQSKIKNKHCKIIYTTIENITKGREIGSVNAKNIKYITL
jgi:predicted ribosome quality control (RQC) complex YloA/Tae2 family protein